MPERSRLTSSAVACWVIKTRTPPEQIVAGWEAGHDQVLHRCLRPSYRAGLMAEGQRCLLWLSGRTQPGVHAVGSVIEAARPRPAGEVPQLEVVLVLRLLEVVVPREEWRADPVLGQAEVIRMPAGANPSFLSPEMFSALRDLMPVDTGAVW